MSGPPDTLDRILADLWRRLVDATAPGAGRDAFHTPTLSTVSPDGEPEARVVVLRDADAAQRRLVCHTDVRCLKVAAIRAHPRVAWTFYDRDAKLQLRAMGRATVHTDDAFADARWAASSLSSRRCYLAPHPPGAPSPDPSGNLPAHVIDRIPTAEESEAGRTHFAAVSCCVDHIDWLHLASSGHRRATFAWDGPTWRSAWVHV